MLIRFEIDHDPFLVTRAIVYEGEIGDAVERDAVLELYNQRNFTPYLP